MPLLAAFALIVVAGIGFGVYKIVGGKRSGSALSFESMKITKLTDTGKAGSAAISPDGKYVVHVKEDNGQHSLWVRHIATGSNVQIIPPAEVEYRRMTLSPDGSYIYFVRREKDVVDFSLYQVPVLGGEPKRLIERVNSPVTFSPDGKRVAFLRGLGAETTMIIANADGSGEQPLVTVRSPESFSSGGPAWSPDGKVIASGTGSTDGGLHGNLVEVRVDDGSVKPIGSHKWTDVGRTVWLADGSGLIAVGLEQDANSNQIYHISYPGGEVRRVTNDVNDYQDISLTADSGSMVTVQEDSAFNIWSASDGDTSRVRQLTRGSGKSEGKYGVRWTPDGKIVYVSSAGSPRIWIMNGDGSNPRQLTQDFSYLPTVSPDGRYIIYGSLGAGTVGTWRMDIDGGNPKQLDDNRGLFTSISPDGRWVVYRGIYYGRPGGLMKVSIDGGDPVRLFAGDDPERLRPWGDAVQPAISPDGKSIAYVYRKGLFRGIAIMPFDGGEPAKLLDLPPGYNTAASVVGRHTGGASQALHWLPDGRFLAYIVTRDGVSNIWSMPINVGAPKQLTNFTTDQIAWFDLSRDGKPTLFSRGTTTKDVVLISGFRK